MYREYLLVKDALYSLGFYNPAGIDQIIQQPNFALMAEIVRWAVGHIAPATLLPDSVDTEDQRIAFVIAATRGISTVVALDPAVLYRSDRACLPELHKLLAVLVRAAERVRCADGALQAPPLPPPPSSTLYDSARRAAADLARAGGELVDELDSAAEIANAADKALGDTDVSAARADLVRRAGEINTEADRAGAEASALRESLHAVQVQLQRRRSEVERARARLAGLEAAEPPFAEEVQAAENRLSELTRAYALRYRNVVALEAEIARADAAAEAERASLAAEIQGLRSTVADERSAVLMGAPATVDTADIDEVSAPEQLPWADVSNGDESGLEPEIETEEEYEYTESPPTPPPVAETAAPASAARVEEEFDVDSDFDAKIEALDDELGDLGDDLGDLGDDLGDLGDDLDLQF